MVGVGVLKGEAGGIVQINLLHFFHYTIMFSPHLRLYSSLSASVKIPTAISCTECFNAFAFARCQLQAHRAA
jgi:hypothetical protein